MREEQNTPTASDCIHVWNVRHVCVWGGLCVSMDVSPSSSVCVCVSVSLCLSSIVYQAYQPGQLAVSACGRGGGEGGGAQRYHSYSATDND